MASRRQHLRSKACSVNQWLSTANRSTWRLVRITYEISNFLYGRRFRWRKSTWRHTRFDLTEYMPKSCIARFESLFPCRFIGSQATKLNVPKNITGQKRAGALKSDRPFFNFKSPISENNLLDAARWLEFLRLRVRVALAARATLDLDPDLVVGEYQSLSYYR